MSNSVQKTNFNVLAIETSCDDTAVALVSNSGQILFERVYNQSQIHNEFGGVVPEIAARSHVQILPRMMDEIFSQNNILHHDIDAIAVTAGPGLIGGVIVGVMFAKAMSFALKKPCIPINHLMGHSLVSRLEYSEVKFPHILLLISGGHSQLLLVKGVLDYQILGSTADDALGEAFDKTAKILGFEYPGGPVIEKLAVEGDERAFLFPRPFFGEKNCNFSFSGLKTAVRRKVEELRRRNYDENLGKTLSYKEKCDIAASFQSVVSEILVDRLISALDKVNENAVALCSMSKDKDNIQGDIHQVVVAGGVAANRYLKCKIERELKAQRGVDVIFPSPKFCTDNGVMIAWAAIEMIQCISMQKTQQIFSDLEFQPRSRWALNDLNYCL